jgi:hypothetical protein
MAGKSSKFKIIRRARGCGSGGVVIPAEIVNRKNIHKILIMNDFI